MSYTFVKLTTGDISINHIMETCEDLNGTDFQFEKWKPRAALVAKNKKTKQLYTGQKFDPAFFDLIEDSWTDDDCQICFVSIGEQANQYTQTDGFFNGYDWVCKSCYETFINTANLQKKLEELPQYQK
jgi:hypothetical protein